MIGSARLRPKRKPLVLDATDREAVARVMKTPEAELQANILRLAKLLGWRVAHFRPAQMRSGRWATAMQGDVGFPDLVLARGGYVIFAELKADEGRLSDAQCAWLDALAGPLGQGSSHRRVLITTWRPHAWKSGDIERALRAPDDDGMERYSREFERALDGEAP